MEGRHSGRTPSFPLDPHASDPLHLVRPTTGLFNSHPLCSQECHIPRLPTLYKLIKPFPTVLLIFLNSIGMGFAGDRLPTPWPIAALKPATRTPPRLLVQNAVRPKTLESYYNKDYGCCLSMGEPDHRRDSALHFKLKCDTRTRAKLVSSSTMCTSEKLSRRRARPACHLQCISETLHLSITPAQRTLHLLLQAARLDFYLTSIYMVLQEPLSR